MACIVTTPDFEATLDASALYASYVFGKKTVKRWYCALDSIYRRLMVMPESYPYMRVGNKIYKRFRGATIMHNFKVLYTYDEKMDIVNVLTLLDMRQDTKKLNSILLSLSK